MNIIIHNVPELDSKDRKRRVDHDKKEILSIAGSINVDIDIVKVIRLGKKVEGTYACRIEGRNNCAWVFGQC